MATPVITLENIDTAKFEECQMYEMPLVVYGMEHGHPALDGTSEEPVYVEFITSDGDTFDGYAVDTFLTPRGNMATRFQVS